jgi:hypothetical protein
MKLFDISDVLSITTGRLVSSRHIDGVYDILDFMTGDNLFTHQLARASDECKPWLRSQYPRLFPEEPFMEGLLLALDSKIAEAKPNGREAIAAAVDDWVERVREGYKLPRQIPVYELGAEMHTHIDPIEEAEAMVGKDRVVVVEIE